MEFLKVEGIGTLLMTEVEGGVEELPVLFWCSKQVPQGYHCKVKKVSPLLAMATPRAVSAMMLDHQQDTQKAL